MSSENLATIAAGRQEIAAAIQAFWHEQQERVPDLPPVFVRWGNNPRRPPAVPCHLRLGPWRHELELDDVRAAQGAQKLANDLKHEAVHSLAGARGIQDTSANGRYHNDRYRELAELFELVVADDDWENYRGWWNTKPRSVNASANLQTPAGRQLQAALDAYRPGDPVPAAPTGRPKRLEVRCGCSDPDLALHVTLARFNRGRIHCPACQQDFRLVNPPPGA